MIILAFPHIGSKEKRSTNSAWNYPFIPLDIFRENVQNKGIKNKLDAWLAFLSMDEPEQIIDLITAYPEFKVIYEHVYNICRNVEELMGIFSEELKILDRNTVKYMVDQMQETIDEQKAQIAQQKNQLAEKDQQLIEKNQQMQKLSADVTMLKEQLQLLQAKDL